jgi:hypothetical protein
LEHIPKQCTVKKIPKIKTTILLNNFLTVRDNKSKHKYDIFKINKGSNAENFSQIGATFGVCR